MSRRPWIAGLISAALHLAIIAGVLVREHWARPSPDAPDKPVAVELVMEEQRGVNETVVQPAPSPPAEPAPPPRPPTPEVAVAPGLASPPSSQPPVPPRPPAMANPAVSAPHMNLGGTDSESNTLVLGGENVIPASPDQKARNRPPIYPDDAARRGEQGAVILVIHVSPDGLPAGVDVARSSGYPSLDRAAREAVMAWRFLPAIKDGAAIPFDMPMRFVFAFN